MPRSHAADACMTVFHHALHSGAITRTACVRAGRACIGFAPVARWCTYIRNESKGVIEQFDAAKIERIARVQNTVADSLVETAFG